MNRDSQIELSDEDISSGAVFYIGEKVTFIEDHGYPEAAVKYIYNMCRAMESLVCKVDKKDGAQFESEYACPFEAFVSVNAKELGRGQTLIRDFLSSKYTYIYHLSEAEITIYEISSIGIEEKFKGILSLFFNRYATHSACEDDWQFSPLIKNPVRELSRYPTQGALDVSTIRDFVSEAGLREWLQAYTQAAELLTEHQRNHRHLQSLLLRINKIMKALNLKTINSIEG